jgi:hypothetical protein
MGIQQSNARYRCGADGRKMSSLNPRLNESASHVPGVAAASMTIK